MARNLVKTLSGAVITKGLRCERWFPISTRAQSFSVQAEPETAEEINFVDPIRHHDYFKVHKYFTVKDLFDAKVHYGHKEGSLNVKMKPFIYGSRLGHLIIDLDKTAELLRHALNFAAHIAYNDGVILFIARSPQNAFFIDKTAKECGEFSHTRHFLQGTFTNSVQEFGAIVRLPDLCIFLNTLCPVMLEHVAVSHSAKMCIPTIGIVDTNCDPNLITYPVPGNDDTPSAIELYCNLFKRAILEGKEARKKHNDLMKQ